jgi:hypothetical protein
MAIRKRDERYSRVHVKRIKRSCNALQLHARKSSVA